MPVTSSQIKLHFGKGYNKPLPPGWILKESPEDWALGIAPDGQEYFLGSEQAFPRRIAIKDRGSIKKGEHYVDLVKGVINLTNDNPSVVATKTPSPFLVPSAFMERVKIAQDIKSMGTLEIAQRLRCESDNNGNINWNDEEPEKCWYRQLVIELGNRIYSQIEPEEWGDWKDEFCGLLTGIAGYDDAYAFRVGRIFEIKPEDWNSLESFLSNDKPELPQ